MLIDLGPELEAVLKELARRQGVTPEALAVTVLWEYLLAVGLPVTPQDDWERRLLDAATDCGVSLPHSALRSEALYE